VGDKEDKVDKEEFLLSTLSKLSAFCAGIGVAFSKGVTPFAPTTNSFSPELLNSCKDAKFRVSTELLSSAFCRPPSAFKN
jgi:hypothetical protein